MRRFALTALLLSLPALASAQTAGTTLDGDAVPQLLSAERTPSVRGPALQLRPSVMYAFTKGDRAHGFGVGLELMRYPGSSPLRWGFFAETQAELDGAWRTAGGFGLGWGGFGMNVGIAHRTLGDYATSTMIHLAKTFHWGPVGVSGRIGIPVHETQPSQGPPLPTRGVEFGMVLSVGWSFNLQGDRSAWGCDHHGHHGRASR